MEKLLQENMNEVVRLQTALGAVEDELQSSQAARCTAEAEVKTLEESKHLELQRMEKLLQENMNEVVRLQTALGAVEDELQRSQVARCTAEAEIKALEERSHCTAKAQQDVTAVELESAKAAVAKLLASVSEKDLSIVELHSKLEEKNEDLTVIKSTHLEVMTKMKAELNEKVTELNLLRENAVASAAGQEQEYSQLKEHNMNLQVKVAALESEMYAIQTNLLLLKQELEAAKAHATQQEAITADVYEVSYDLWTCFVHRLLV
jgi:chromosome segregation ATPase